MDQDVRRSNVRVAVTYMMSGAYVLAALGTITFLLWCKKFEEALAVFTGLASTSAAIVSFWFGSRGSVRAAAAGTEAAPTNAEQTSNTASSQTDKA